MGRLFDNDKTVAETRLNQILDAVQSQNSNNLKQIFSKSVIDNVPDLDEKIVALFDFFQGELVSYDGAGPGVFEEKDVGYHKKEMQSSYNVETSEQKYRIAIDEYIIDSENPDNVGVYSLSIAKAEDTNQEFAYWNLGFGITIDQKKE